MGHLLLWHLGQDLFDGARLVLHLLEGLDDHGLQLLIVCLDVLLVPLHEVVYGWRGLEVLTEVPLELVGHLLRKAGAGLSLDVSKYLLFRPFVFGEGVEGVCDQGTVLELVLCGCDLGSLIERNMKLLCEIVVFCVFQMLYTLCNFGKTGRGLAHGRIFLFFISGCFFTPVLNTETTEGRDEVDREFYEVVESLEV